MYLARAAFALMFAVGASTIMVQAQDEPKPDNTKVNQRDRSANQPTADQQKNNVSDRDLTKQIRRKIVQDKSLSTYGHNVKVISQNGMVTLRGPVHSEEEKRAIENHAVEVAGHDRVKNEIEVKGDADRSK
jgi:osmotically-inducible protein OsmY